VDLVGSVFEPSSPQVTRISNQIRLQIFAEAAQANIPVLFLHMFMPKGLDDEFINK